MRSSACSFSFSLIKAKVGLFGLVHVEGVTGNILSAIPDGTWYSIVISIFMVVTCIGGYPLYVGPIHEMVEGDWGRMTSNKVFITNWNYIISCWVRTWSIAFTTYEYVSCKYV